MIFLEYAKLPLKSFFLNMPLILQSLNIKSRQSLKQSLGPDLNTKNVEQ